MKKIKVVNIITGLSPGGAEIMLLKLLERIDRNHFSPHVISLTTKGKIGPRIEELGIPVEDLKMGYNYLLLGNFIKLIFRLRKLRPDVIHTWMYHADLLGGLAAIFAGITKIAWGIRHGNFSLKYNKFSTLMIARACGLISRWIPRKIISCSKLAGELHVNIGYDNQKMIIIPNGFDVQRFQPEPQARNAVRQELELSPEVPLVGMIARYHPQKNFRGFCQAAGLIHKQLPNVHFLLAGTDVDKSNDELRKSLDLFGVWEVTHLLSRQENIPRLMSALDVLASTSYSEGFSNVLGEAMACCVPCVVTDVGDSAEIVKNTGRIVKSGDMNGLAKGVLEVLAMSKSVRQDLGQHARDKIILKYEIGKVVSRYEAFYDSML
jgi:glycosyltransferase involved in cell wall biosynthesis